MENLMLCDFSVKIKKEIKEVKQRAETDLLNVCQLF